MRLSRSTRLFATSSCLGWSLSDLSRPPPTLPLVSLPADFLPSRRSTDPNFVDASRLQKALSDAEHSLGLTRKEKDEKERDINRLFDPSWYGAEGEWKKLDRTCISKEVGEYVLPLSSDARKVADILVRPQLHLRSVSV